MAQNKTSQAEFDAKIAVVSDLDWARLAMALGCEGSIFIQRNVRNKYGQKKPTYVLTLAIGNTDPLLMMWLHDTFGGTLYSYENLKTGVVKSRRRMISWRAFDDRAAVLLQNMLPFMIMKREQAQVALAYREVRKLGSKGRKLTAEDIAVRDGFYQQIRQLNSGSTEWKRRRDGGNTEVSHDDISEENKNGSHVQ